MKAKGLIGLLLCVSAALLTGSAWALDEAVLTPTPESRHAGAMTEKDKADAEKQFNAAMSVWFSHDYASSERKLEEFARV